MDYSRPALPYPLGDADVGVEHRRLVFLGVGRDHGSRRNQVDAVGLPDLDVFGGAEELQFSVEERVEEQARMPKEEDGRRELVLRQILELGDQLLGEIGTLLL